MDRWPIEMDLQKRSGDELTAQLSAKGYAMQHCMKWSV
jgi:hypothetical protein